MNLEFWNVKIAEESWRYELNERGIFSVLLEPLRGLRRYGDLPLPFQPSPEGGQDLHHQRPRWLPEKSLDFILADSETSLKMPLKFASSTDVHEESLENLTDCVVPGPNPFLGVLIAPR